ncbi:ABC-F family ATP-binding cassette domain-containing protein [Thermithiobacillus plumbiphilus]|uniref:ATP-binding cassette domain-containing protein n=1 Tax=Thermithiobacillus plumbiphilus TaxID=1729899 RepID=A0ABU9DAT6_9PROT
MLSIQNLSYHAGPREILSKASLQVFHGQRVGLVGRNGGGKSTLLALIRGELQPDGGDIHLQAGVSIASVAQEIDNADRPAIEFVLDGDTELRELEAVLASNQHDERYFAAQSRFEAIDGFGAKARAAQLLAGLGFAADSIDRLVNSFSGGWRMRLNLARALMRRADLLLLDEPTNHLDLEAILWLEQYLARYPGAIILVSHDRDFLNAVVDRIAYLEDGAITLYTGSYDDFEAQRAARIEQQNAQHAQQERRIAHLEEFVNRFRAKATKARQAQSRLKQLERIERIARVQVSAGYSLEIPSPEQPPQTLLNLEQASFGYGTGPLLFQRLSLTLRPGDRVGLLGPNGAGKSTLIKLLTGALRPTTGQCQITPGVRIGYFAQHQLEELDPDATPMEHLQRLDPRAETQTLRNYLGRYGFGSQEMDRPVRGFSGGEKSRLALAGIAWRKPHLLLLDEPTNHLDLDMRDALLIALQEYAGAVLLVSHDRYLLNTCVDQFFLVADGEARVFDGDLDDYRQWLNTRQARTNAAVKAEKPKPAPNPGKRQKALRQKQERIETQMNTLEAQLARLDSELADPALYQADALDRVQALNAEREALQARFQVLEEEWLGLEMELEECAG